MTSVALSFYLTWTCGLLSISPDEVPSCAETSWRCTEITLYTYKTIRLTLKETTVSDDLCNKAGLKKSL